MNTNPNGVVIAIEPATKKDIPQLVELMTAFYTESDFECNPDKAARSFKTLIENHGFGMVWIFKAENRPIGYMVLCMTFSMEYGGWSAFLDDLYIDPKFRNKGIGAQAMSVFIEACRKRQVQAIHLEVGQKNTRALALYRRFGFAANDRVFLTKRLES